MRKLRRLASSAPLLAVAHLPRPEVERFAQEETSRLNRSFLDDKRATTELARRLRALVETGEGGAIPALLSAKQLVPARFRALSARLEKLREAVEWQERHGDALRRVGEGVYYLACSILLTVNEHGDEVLDAAGDKWATREAPPTPAGGMVPWRAGG